MLRKYPLLFFFLITYAISWFFWTPLLLAKQGIISDQPPQYLHLLGSLGPAVAALVMTRVCSGSVGLQNLWITIWGFAVLSIAKPQYPTIQLHSKFCCS